MSSTTDNLELFKYNTTTDGSSTFNIDTSLNDNWDKIDTAIGDLGDLTTTEKDNLVEAINEVAEDVSSIDLNPDIIALGNKSTNFTLTADRIHTANITGSCTLSLPTISTTTKFVNCMIDFTLAGGVSLTLPTVTWDYGYVPTLSTSVRNRVYFDSIDNGTTWHASYQKKG